MALTEAQKREVFAGVHKRLGSPARPKKHYEKSWTRNFIESLLSDPDLNPGLTTFEGLAKKDLPKLATGVGLSAFSGLRGNVASDAGAAVKRGMAKVGEKLPKLKELAEKKIKLPELIGDETGTFGSVVGAKVGRAKKLIEESGGKNFKDKDGIISWTDAATGKSRSVDLNTERFGPRQLGLSARQTGTNIREKFAAPRDKLLNPRMKEQGKLYRTTAEAKRAAEIAEAEKKGVKLGDLPSLKGERGSFGGPPKRFGDEPKPPSIAKKAEEESLEDTLERMRRTNPVLDRQLRQSMRRSEQQDILDKYAREKKAIKENLILEGKYKGKEIPPKYRGKEKPNFPIEDYGEGFEFPVKTPTGKIKGRDGSEWKIEVTDDETDEVIMWVSSANRAEPEVGSLSLRPSADGKYLEIGVAGLSEGMQGRGIGTQLYQEALRVARSKGYKGISSDPQMRNQRSGGLWEKIKTGTETNLKYPSFSDTRDVKLYGGLGLVPPKMRPGKTIESRAIPKVSIPKGTSLVGNIGGKKIKFASDFDKIAYNLHQKFSGKLMSNITKQTGFDANTIMAHGAKIANSIESRVAAKQPLTLRPRSVRVIGVAKPEHWMKTILGTARASKFSIDLPAGRQGLRTIAAHPSSALPSLRRAKKSFSEKGYLQELDKMANETQLYDIIDIADALGPKKAAERYPNIDLLRKMAPSDVGEYFTTSQRAEGLPGIGDTFKMSKRQYDIQMRSLRAAEAERLPGLLGTTLDKMAKDPKRAGDLANIARSVMDRTGFGPGWGYGPLNELAQYGITAPRNISAKAMLWNPLNWLPANVFEKGGSIGKGLLKRGAAGRYGKNFSDPIYKDFMKDQGKLAALYGGAGAAAGALGAETNWNPFSNKPFVSFNGYNPDFSGGEKAFPRLAIRSTLGTERESAKGLPYQAGMTESGDPSQWKAAGEEFGRFARGRISPGPFSMATDLFAGGTNYLGEDISKPYDEQTDPLGHAVFGDTPYSRWIASQFVPATFEDIGDIYDTAGPATTAIATPFSMLGFGSSSYDPYEPNPYRPEKNMILIDKRKKNEKKKGKAGSF